VLDGFEDEDDEEVFGLLFDGAEEFGGEDMLQSLLSCCWMCVCLPTLVGDGVPEGCQV